MQKPFFCLALAVSVFAEPTLIEESGTFSSQAATLARSPQSGLDLFWQGLGSWSGGEYAPTPPPQQRYGLGLQRGMHRFSLEGDSTLALHDWAWLQGFDIGPGIYGGMSFSQKTRLPWRQGLQIALDAQFSYRDDLRFSLGSEPRAWNDNILMHRWGLAWRPFPQTRFFRHSWLGMEWPWSDAKSLSPTWLASLHAPAGLILNCAYDQEKQQGRAALVLRLRPQMSWAAVMDENRHQTYRAQIRRLPAPKPFLPGPAAVQITWDKPWVEGETQKNWLGETQALGFADVLQSLDALEQSAETRRIFIVIRGLRADLPMAQEVGRRLDGLVQQGRRIHVYLDNVTPLGLLLGSHTQGIAVYPQGYFGVQGFSAGLTFYRGFFQKVGIQPQFIRHGRYKGFDEPYMRREPSPEMAFNTREWMQDLWQAYVGEVAVGRRRDAKDLQSFLDRGEISLDSAKRYGLIDTVLQEKDAREWACGHGLLPKQDWPLARAQEPRFGSKPVVAVLTLKGPIVEAGQGSLLNFSEPGFSPAQVLPWIEAVKKQAGVAAVVLRLDSPGGSAQASDMMAAALDGLRESGKPVVVSVGGMAASGGYYLATAANRIVAEPTSLLGSIGVVWGKFSLDSLYAKLGLTHTAINTAPHADAASMNRPWTAAESLIVQKHLDGFYHSFAKRVQISRKLDSARLDSVTEGRVFLGARSQQNGLVDTLGGLETAIVLARRLARIPEKTEITLRHDDLDNSDWAGMAQGAVLGFGLGKRTQALNRWLDGMEAAAQGPAVWAIAPDYLGGPER